MCDKSNKKFWDKFAKLYAPFMRKDKGVYDKVCEYICSYLNKDMNALELACGSGQLSLSLSKYTKNWIGTDFSEQMILEARKHGEYENLAFEIADATSLNFVDGEFDCVVIANALHIMPNPDKAMIEIYRVLKPNGILLYATCSVLPDENSQQIQHFLSETPDAELMPLPFEQTENTIGIQFLPQENGGDGFYYAKLRKRSA